MRGNRLDIIACDSSHSLIRLHHGNDLPDAHTVGRTVASKCIGFSGDRPRREDTSSDGERRRVSDQKHSHRVAKEN